MMDELCYSALDIAVVLSGLELDCREEAAFLNRVWEYDRAFLQKKYRTDKRKWLLSVLHWTHYLYDKQAIDSEFPAIQLDALASGGNLQAEKFTSDFSDLELFFKNARLHILFGPGKDYVRVKRRTLMARYGYKRLSPALVEHFHRCTYFYHLQPYVRDGVECRIEKAEIDEMIIFRVI